MTHPPRDDCQPVAAARAWRPCRAATRLVLTSAALAAGIGAMAQAPPAKPAPCASAEHRQFDFWVGRWVIFTPDGKQAGENRIEAIDGGCALQERWRGTGGFTGTSLNHWDAVARVWRQHWVDNQGGSLRLAGGVEGASMVLSGSEPQADEPGKVLRHRISWTPLVDGAVRQWWQSSQDDGKTWSTAFDGRYVRQP